MLSLVSSTCLAESIEKGECFIASNGKKIVHYKDDRLVFYDGFKEDANAVTEIDCKGKRVIASQQGNYIGIAPGGVAEIVKVSIFNNSGKLSGEFTNNESYNLRSISDIGPLVGLGYEGLDEPSFYPTRLYDNQGKLLYGYKDSLGGIKFAGDGTPIVLTIDPNNSEQRSLSVLDLKGDIIAAHKIDPAYSVDSFNSAIIDGPVCALINPKKQIHANILLVWFPDSGITREINVKDDKLGIVQPNFSISPNGNYVVIQIGYKGLLLYDVSKDATIYKRAFNLAVGGQEIDKFLDVAVNNNAKVLVTGLYDDPLDKKKIITTCSLLDKEGNVLNSTIVNRSFSDRPNIQLLSDGSFAISSGSDDKVMIMN